MTPNADGRPRFDRERFHATLDATRTARGLTRRAAAREAGVSPSTFTRLAKGHTPDADGFAALVVWMGRPADDFIVRTRPVETPEPFAAALARLSRHSGLEPRMALVLERATLAMYQALREPAVTLPEEALDERDTAPDHRTGQPERTTTP